MVEQSRARLLLGQLARQREFVIVRIRHGVLGRVMHWFVRAQRRLLLLPPGDLLCQARLIRLRVAQAADQLTEFALPTFCFHSGETFER